MGSALEPLVDDSQLPPAQELAARVLGAAETLARLHRVGSNDLREYSGDSASEFADLEFEVRRWARVFSTVDLDLNGADEVCAMRLLAKTPKPLRRSIVHGDFRLGNIVCDGGHVIAVLDWEIWSLTDPRIDVGWFLMTLSADGLPSAIRTSAPGLPSPEEALSVYETAIETKLADLSWFGALSRFRAAAAMSLNIKHNRRRPTPDPRIESYAGKLPEFLALASDLIA